MTGTKHIFNQMNIAICHGCFRVIKRSSGQHCKCRNCGATHFSWLEPRPGYTIDQCRSLAELRIRSDFAHAHMDDAARMAFVRQNQRSKS